MSMPTVSIVTVQLAQSAQPIASIFENMDEAEQYIKNMLKAHCCREEDIRYFWICREHLLSALDLSEVSKVRGKSK